MARRPEAPWFGLLVLGTAFEVWALRNKRQEATASAFTRRVFCTRTMTGKAVFLASWTWFYVWFMDHIVTKENQPWG